MYDVRLFGGQSERGRDQREKAAIHQSETLSFIMSMATTVSFHRFETAPASQAAAVRQLQTSQPVSENELSPHHSSAPSHRHPHF